MKEKTRKSRKGEGLSYGSRNYNIFAIGLLVIILGFVLMTKGPADSFLSLTLSPILLIIGYCIIIPLAILYRPKQKQQVKANW